MKFQIAMILFSICLLLIARSSPAVAAEKWSGVDETVIEKYAHEHGREAKKPLIDTDKGDLLLFLFLIAGAAGGFVAGYSWKALAGAGKQKAEEKRRKTE